MLIAEQHLPWSRLAKTGDPKAGRDLDLVDLRESFAAIEPLCGLVRSAGLDDRPLGLRVGSKRGPHER
jgi:hypothetical protein